MAQTFAREGAKVIAADMMPLTYECENVEFYQLNVTDGEACKGLFEYAKEKFGKIDILVNNAGQTKDGLMLRMSEEQWDSIINTNLKSAFNFIHAVTPVMARRRAGSIVNISSVVGTNGNAGQCNYAASKAGLIGLTMSMAKEMGGRGIRCNAIAPGFIITDMTDKLSDAVKEAIVAAITLGRMGTVEEIANVALFLASDMSSYVTGQTIKCCGGMKG